jgi:excisionase family DNA binding protein
MRHDHIGGHEKMQLHLQSWVEVKMFTMESDEILTVEEVASFLKLHPKTVYKFLKDSEIQGYRIGRQWRFRKSEVMKLFEKPTLKVRKIR